MDTKINKLEDIDKTKNPFKVPDNYFVHFNEEIMNRLPEKEAPNPQPIPLWEKVRPWVYMAAIFLGLYFTFNILTKDNRIGTVQTTSTQPISSGSQYTDNYWSTVQITEEEFYQYLEDRLMEDGFYDYIYSEIYLN